MMLPIIAGASIAMSILPEPAPGLTVGMVAAGMEGGENGLYLLQILGGDVNAGFLRLSLQTLLLILSNFQGQKDFSRHPNP